MKKTLLFFALLCAFAQGAWAQANWDAVYAMTSTNSGNWTALTGSTTGQTLGSEGNTTYYYANSNLSFTNSTAGGSGLTILGTVYIYVPDGVTITCTGANATAPTGAGAGIELASGNTLYIIGGGTVNATGGNAANGGNGGTGGNAGGVWDEWTSTGAGGTGGNGGGGAGAGIGTRGGNGGSGGAGGSSNTYHDDSSAHNGTNGSTGNAGSTADAMGNLYVVSSFVHLSATGGAAGTSGGSGGQRGRGRIDDDNPNYSVSGGGGGGGGGFGGAASNIGTGGPGGGGGGGGAGGAQDYKYSGYYDVTSYGGNGGQNADGSYAATGTEAPTTRIAMENNWVDTNYAWGNNDANPPSNQCTFGSGGSGAAKGNASTAGTANNILATDADGIYLIGSATDWNTFAAQVANGTDSYSGKSLKLMADISVTTMVGNCNQWGHPYNPFQGTFDGNGHTLTFTCGTSSEPYNINYCAPFRNVDGATIQNLKVAGNIYTSQEDAGGLVSYCKGTTSIIGCYVSTIIHSSKSGYGYHGGIVAVSDYNTLNITGCVYTGRLLTNNGTTKCGGFGYTYNVHLSISNSLYAPSGSIPEGWTAINDGATFVQGSTISYNLTNYYYTETLGTAQGTQAVVSSPFNLGSLVQDYGMLKAYEHGIIYNDICYVDANLASAETGTEDDPYTISSTDDWNGFANAVTGGYTFSGQFVKLNADIEVSTMAGADDANSFQGTFDGDGHTMTFTKGTSESPFSETYCAPFRHVKGATIKNLHVDGTIYTSVQKAAGFVGESHGGLNITNCHSSINIHSSKSGDGTHGGFVATLSGAGNEITIEGCVFDGSFATTANTTNCGGFIGWGVYNKPTVKNSLMKPSSVPASMLINTFARWYTGDGGIYEPTITNCYYVAVDNLPTDQGKQTHTISAGEYVTISGLGAATTTYDVSGITSYAKGIKYNSVYYAGNGENVSLTLSHGDKNGYILRNYTASAGTLNGSTLTMPDTDVTINAEWMEFLLTGTGTSEDPYIIDNAEQWNNFADAVSIGYTFSGQYVKLNDDISVETMVGTGESNSFQGTFLGNGKTLTFNKTISQNYYYSAPFRYVNGATIQDLKVKGDVYTYGYYTGGLVARSYGATTISNCHISAVIHNRNLASDYGDYFLGGVVASHQSGALTITGCVYSGCLLTIDTDLTSGGFVSESFGTSITITNSIFAPNFNIPLISGESVSNVNTFVRWSQQGVSVNVTNCYYTYSSGGGTRVYAIIPGDFVTVANAGDVSNAYDVSELTFYTTGIQCGDALYAVNGQNVSLTLGSQPNCQVTAFTASAGTLSGSGNPYTLTMPEQNVTIGATNVTVDNLQGEGTSENPYTINNADDWRIFCLNVDNNNTYSGEYVKLMADISVSKMAGTSGSNSFQGTFLGNNKTLTFTKGSIENIFSEEQCAPFRHVNGATIQDLKVTGAIYTSKKHAGGLIAHCYNTTYITNCHVSTIIYNDCGDNNGRVRHGGIVGLLNEDWNTKLYIQGCSYTGRLLTDRNIEWCGGFVSYYSYSHAYITNSLYAPGSIPSGWSTSITNSRTFNCGEGNVINCYYTETLGLAQGTLALSTATDPGTLGSVVQEYGMMTVYDNGILYDGTYYVAPAPLSGTGEEATPYLIRNEFEWNCFATFVNSGTNYSGQFIRLDESISVSTMVGTSDDRSFQGTFLGNNKTLTFTKGTSESAFNEEYCAPFRYVKNATIQDLKVAGDIYTSRKFAAGLVAQPSSTTNITNCIVSTVIHSNVSGDGTHGGIVARLGSTTEMNITGCVFNGRLLTNNGTHSCAGFVGWWDSKTANIINSLYAPDANITPSAGETAITNGATFIRDENNATYATCYYTETLGVAQGAQAYAFATAPANLGSLVQDYGMVTAYENGIFYNGTYYVPSTGNISLSVEGYGDEDGKWAFIASPVNSDIAPTTVENIFSATEYDLYRLNPSSSTWENYQAHTGDFNLVNGQGYLYATKETKTLVFSGTFNMGNEKTVELSQGFNLVGNPFVMAAYVSKPFYQMNAEGTDIVAIDNYDSYTPVAIPPCTGIVVRADGADNVTFSTSAPQQQSANNNGNIQMTLTKAGVRSDAFQDKAIVSFNEGSELEKFIFNENHAKLYIPQYGEDYAIASSEMTGEVPLNFKANETGRYTIGFNFENVKGVRIQLIDKIEDKIIDLNKDVSGNVSTYTFMGSTIDRSDRFTLVFTQVETDGVFAYQSGNDIIVSGEGELQVFDVMGRMVMNQHINGVQTVEKPSTTGVYILRLNGKTQKMVVR